MSLIRRQAWEIMLRYKEKPKGLKLALPPWTVLILVLQWVSVLFLSEQ